ncbi:type II toxin-antitoxin system Phd/YefM family antitoxin [Leptothoe spongobia]|uniref:Antitoxin n=1 Tax=Leptothoe spongobia TAU-MAC 1115 TaxID=1967444 RepID=A0A947DG36_9CYAN|nr:type II toxin-antitoxin system Phd/YefM family antitoxin [Leptothoe spongobia]MBT9316110.1 type II toxin-antitoxin system Phd/YefM family antitoxin [Leptothoe spongobia TAU-MAC 1115]
MTQYSIAQLRERFAQLVHEAEQGNRVEITRQGQRVAVLLSAKEYERLTQPKQTFGEAVLAWREKFGLNDRGEDEEDRKFEAIMDTVRDKSPGPEPFEW